MTGEPLGPFETSSAALLALRADDGSFTSPGDRYQLLQDTMHAAGVALGEWDKTVLCWLANLDVQTVATVAGWVGRAREAGLKAPVPSTVVPPPAASDPVIEVLRSAAAALAADLATWEARDPGDPSPEARQARRAAIATADAVATSLSRLRTRLGGDRP